MSLTECIAFETLRKDIKINNYFYLANKVYDLDDLKEIINLPEHFKFLVKEKAKMVKNGDLHIIPFVYGKLELDKRIIHSIALCHPRDIFNLIHGRETVEGRIRCYFENRYEMEDSEDEKDPKYRTFIWKHTILIEVKNEQI